MFFNKYVTIKMKSEWLCSKKDPYGSYCYYKTCQAYNIILENINEKYTSTEVTVKTIENGLQTTIMELKSKDNNILNHIVNEINQYLSDKFKISIVYKKYNKKLIFWE